MTCFPEKGRKTLAAASDKWYDAPRHGKEMIRMADFIPKEKMSKKARRALDREKRKTWAFSPVTRTVENKKRYDRKRKTHDRYDGYGMGLFFLFF